MSDEERLALQQGPKLQQRRAKWTREKILNAAGELFEERGFLGTSIGDIIKRAGVTKGAFTYHFASKQQVAAAIQESAVALDGVDQDLEIMLQVMVDVGMVLAYRLLDEPFLRAATRLSLEFEAKKNYRTPWADWIQINTDQLNEAKRRGELLPSVDVSAIARQIAGQWCGIVLIAHALDDSLERVEEMVAQMYDMLMESIAFPVIKREIDFSPDRGRRLYRAYLERASQAE
ncbi:ScbR family autoregulator-binding transcription factor [Streptomyces sp. NPDC016566]|uniref:ScbR family autoregulator-binding transcription factor n=1 Tax=Streptomyces sp. NPDC016566 TaxID=3364967 RepID=UPI0036F9809C